MLNLTNIQRKCAVLILVLCVCSVQGMAQLTAAFSATTTSGCAPIVVQFTDQSGGNPTQWRWDLGNGVISYLQHPSATYFNPGTYRIKLVISNTAGSADSLVKEGFINVYPNPQVDLSASDSSGCFPLPVQFTDLSSTSSGRISSWQWDFGDGTTTTLASPLHTYGQAGSYSVTLKVVNSFGCVKTASKAQYIKVAAGVKADFTNSTAALCKAPVLMQFTNKSSGPATLSYSWDFGDGQQSTEPSPAHSYGSPGSYSVRLVVRSSQGCSDTLTKTNLVRVGAATSSFSSPAVVCAGSGVSFVNTSSPAASSVRWSFGDGTGSEQAAPVKVFSKAGVYKVKLVNNFGNCIDSVVHSVEVQPRPKVVFGAEQQQSCKAPFTVQFTNASVGGKAYKWLFGDGSSSEEASPMHTYSSLGAYAVTLIVFNEQGCSDTLVQPEFIKIQKPVISVTGLPRTGCLPLTINPVVNVSNSEPVIGYLWRFGNGATSNDENPTYTYTNAGNYKVTLIITTASGCTDSVTFNDAVRAGNKPDANFTNTPVEVCASLPVQFTDKSTGNPDEWLWIFGDKLMSKQKNPLHVFQEIGQLPVTLIVKSNTCPDTITIKNAVNIFPPIAKFSVANNCADRYTKVFSDLSTGATNWQWNFGDGSTSTDQNPSHKYSAPGTYTVILYVTNGNCFNSYTQVIRVIDEKANFATDYKQICKGAPVKLTAQNINASNIIRTSWDFGDGSLLGTGMSVAHSYTKSGRYTITFSITDILGCTSTQTEDVIVYGPTANFSTGVAAACLYNNNITFKDLSSSDGTYPIEKRVWNYGDGTTDSVSSLPYQHQYQKAGEFAVSLKVVDSYGCTDIITKNGAVIIAQPKADFTSPDSLSCTNKPIRFVNKSTGTNLTYLWNLGNGSASNLPNLTYNYKSTGLYTVELLVTDKYGCKDSIQKENYINISYPSAGFSLSDSFGTCPPLVVNFTNSSANFNTTQWDFNDGNTSVLGNPVHHYTIPGIYYAKLVVTGPGGCKDSLSRKIEVRGPKGTLEYEQQTGCNPLEVTLKAQTSNRLSIIWDYSDGKTFKTQDSVVKHTYTRGGSYVPKMILTDADGCSVPVMGKDTIKVVEVNAKFGLDKRQFCDSGIVQFSDSSISNEPIKSWFWTFGDNRSSSEQHPAYLYKSAGSFTTKLITTTVSGCKDTVTLSRGVDVYQSPLISVDGKLESCAPATLGFKGIVERGNASALKWNWNFGNGQISEVPNPAVQTYTKDGDYQLSAIATDEHGCFMQVAKTINIHPVPSVNAGADKVVCRDASVQLMVSGADSYLWNAESSLSCTSCDKPYADPKEKTVYHVTGFNQFGCSQKDSLVVRVRQNFDLKLSATDSICAGSSTMISASGSDVYSWSPSVSLDNPNIANPKARPQSSTLYTVVAKDSDNCFTKTGTVFIKVNPIPVLDAGEDLSIPAGSSVQIKTTSSPDVKTWQWTPALNLSCANCSTPVAKPKQSTRYNVTVKSIGGCTSTDNVTVNVVCSNSNLFIPNTFSPNGDGYNDRFFPRGKGVAMIRSMRVFNRWGEVVFEKLNFNPNDATNGWNGTYKGQILAPDVFIYSCEVLCVNNEVIPYTGDITLIR